MSASPTHQELADLAQVSRSTVSRALKNDPRISPRTRKRILELADSLNYKPNPLVSSLMQQVRANKRPNCRGTIALISDWKDIPPIGHAPHDTWRRMLLGARKKADETGFQLDNFALSEVNYKEQRLSQILISRGILGVVLGPSIFSRGLALDWDSFSMVAIGFSYVNPRCHRVVHHHFNSVGIIFSELMKRGYRRIGLYLYALQNLNSNRQYEASYLVHQQDLTPEDRLPPCFVQSYEAESFKTWLQESKPDAILVGNNNSFIDWAEEAGFRVPEDLAIINLDHCCLTPSFTGVDHLGEELGSRAVELLVAQIHLNQRGLPKNPSVTYLEGQWQVGETIAKH
ncbi:MAG: LacI family DNA-binding transcriptional regulator [Puniceicoccaceae bacterium]